MNNKIIYGLYVIINTSKDNKSYIGYTSQIKRLSNGKISNNRISQHKRELKQNKHSNKNLQIDYNNKDILVFKTILLGSQKQCKQLEYKLIKSGLYEYNIIGKTKNI